MAYTLNMVEMLLHNKVIPVMVFDGAPLPSKKGTEKERNR
jgi:5'-3' exonuclease